MIGIDILEHERIEEKLKLKNFLNKFLTVNEIKYVNQFKEKTERVAGFFCAKEAVKKASSLAGEISFLDFEILHKKNGAPYVNFVTEKFAHLNNKNFQISISHSKTISVAVCVVL